MRPLSALPRAAFLGHLRRLGACPEARRWEAREKLSPARTWATCPRGDWLLWLAASAGVQRPTVVLAACACARLALRHVPAGEARPLRAIETAELWALGEPGVTLNIVIAARHEAWAADAAAYAAADAAAYAAADDADRTKTLAECADVVRAHIPWAEVETALSQEAA